MKTLTNTQAAKKMKDYMELKVALLNYFEGCNNVQQIQSNLWHIYIGDGFGIEIKITNRKYKCSVGYFNEGTESCKTVLTTRCVLAVEAFIDSYFF